jgi:hypothetical protein
MSRTSRRTILAVAGTGAAAGTVGLSSGTASATSRQKAGSAQESVLAYVKDHRSDELQLMVGEREVVVHDRDLVVRILNAAGGE